MPAKKRVRCKEWRREYDRQRVRTEEYKAGRREYARRCRQSEEGKAYMRRYRETHRDELRESKKRYVAEHQTETKARWAKYRFDHKQQIRESNRRYMAQQRSIARVRTSPDEVYRRAIAALPSGLPRFIRDDVVNSLCLAILEGEINVNDMAAQAKVYLRAYNREYDTFETVSLDKFIPGTKTTYLDALVAAE